MHHGEELVLVDRRGCDLSCGFEHVDRAVIMEAGKHRAKRPAEIVGVMSAQPFDSSGSVPAAWCAMISFRSLNRPLPRGAGASR